MASVPVLALTAAGPFAVGVAWSLVRRDVLSVWAAMAPTLGSLGLLAALTGRIRLAGDLATLTAAGAGAGAGLALYGATAAFMYVFRNWPLLARQAVGIYKLRGGLSPGAALAVSVLVAVPGEELYWRGLVQPLAIAETGWPTVAAAAAVWLVYLGANAFSRSLPILLGAAVGGASWVALAALTGGVAASIGCHAVWTGLMILRPPLFGGPR
jgi:membrane protease YdiL (CAAX protease family)